MIATSGIELRQLEYFLAVYSELHFGRAAERLHISQPPLSQAIRKLEQQLGVELFRRTSRKVTPTEAAHVLAGRARSVLTELESAIAEVRRVGGLMATLEVGASPHIPLGTVHGFLAELRLRDPQLRLQVNHQVAVEQLRLLHTGELDLGIFPATYSDPKLGVERLIPGEPLGALLPVHHRLARRNVVGPADLEEETLLMIPRAPNPEYHDGFVAHLEAAGYRFAAYREIRVMTSREVLFGVIAGTGIALVPPLPELDGVSDLLVRLRLDPPVAMPDTVVAWRTDQPPVMKAAFATVREVARRQFTRSGTTVSTTAVA